jgi:hypothetical protein
MIYLCSLRNQKISSIISFVCFVELFCYGGADSFGAASNVHQRCAASSQFLPSSEYELPPLTVTDNVELALIHLMEKLSGYSWSCRDVLLILFPSFEILFCCAGSEFCLAGYNGSMGLNIWSRLINGIIRFDSFFFWLIKKKFIL